MIAATLREATPADAPAIAALHVASWKATYRGILDDAFLERDVEADRLAHWQALLAAPGAQRRHVVGAFAADGLAGFACVLIDATPRWGALLDNLHARPDCKGRGLGRALLARVARWVIGQSPGAGLNLELFEGNHAAEGFYRALGAGLAERFEEEGPDGRRLTSLRYRWSDLEALVARCEGGGRR